jgi:hypothetical protein
MQSVIKHPKFGYLDYKKKVYLITMKDSKFPLCEGKCKYYTVPLLLRNYSAQNIGTNYQNVLIGYTNSQECANIIRDKQWISTSWKQVSCKDAKQIAEMLSIPLAVIMNNDNNEVFFVPKRN